MQIVNKFSLKENYTVSICRQAICTPIAMASAGENDKEAADQPAAAASKHPEIFYNTSGRYQPLTGRSSAFDLLDLTALASDTS